uniref:Venom protein n=1 Tax=Centruroides hentzi TaxID=88313 RepID=A0A2I9LPY1_9SCOR
MKVYLIVAFSFLAVFGAVQSFTPDEFEDAVCSIPDKYLLRFLNCTISRSPKLLQEAADILYECIDTFYEVDGKLDALLTFGCDNNLRRDKDIKDCVEEKVEDLGHPDEQDISTMEEAAQYCVFQA